MPRSKEELDAALEEQMQALKASCEGFDNGKDWEAKRIAACLHILLHDPMQMGKKPPRTRSLLTQMGIKPELRFPSFAGEYHEDNLIDWHPLAGIRIHTVHGGYVPTSEALPQRDNLRFSAWWDEIVIDLGHGRRVGRPLTRKTLILTVRDQDGGGHFDDTISDETYETFIRTMKSAVDIEVIETGEIKQLKGFAHLASIRTIAREFLLAMRRYEAGQAAAPTSL